MISRTGWWCRENRKTPGRRSVNTASSVAASEETTANRRRRSLSVTRAAAAWRGAERRPCWFIRCASFGTQPEPSTRASSSYLVDPASSHMLVSKIKPCMSKYTPLHGETANGSLNQLWFLRSYNPTWITVAILELIHASQLRPCGKSAFVSPKPIRSSRPVHLW